MKKFLKDNGTLIAAIVLMIILAIVSESFRTAMNFSNLFRQIAIIGLMSVGMTMVILIGGIDLSVGSVVAFCGVTVALLMHAGVNVWIAILLTLIAGALIGMWNGFFIAKFRIPPFIITLGMMTIARGMALIMSNQTTIPVDNRTFYAIANNYFSVPFSAVILIVGLAVFVLFSILDLVNRKRYEMDINLSEWIPNFILGLITVGFFMFAFLGYRGIPVPVAIMGATVMIGVFVLNKTRFGRRLYAIGGNEEAARLSGINIFRSKMAVFAIMSLLAAVGGIIAVSRLDGGSPNEGEMLELDVIAAVVIGGTSLTGGSGTVSNSLVGAFIIGIVNNGMSLLQIPSPVQNVVKGFIIILAVLFDVLQKRRKK